MSYYAVRNGFRPGIYNTWDECEKQVKGFSNAKYKKFKIKEEALEFIGASYSLNLNVADDKKFDTTDHVLIKPKLELKQYSELEQDPELNYSRPVKRKLSEKSTNSDGFSSKSKVAKTRHTAQSNQYKKSKNSNREERCGIKTELKSPETNNHSIISSFSINKSKNSESEPNKQDIKFSFNGEKVSVYTDGACSGNGKVHATGGIGIYWCKDDHPLNTSRKLLGKQTNNRAEITAAIVAIEQAITYNASEVTILTDSMFMINCVTKWMSNWKRNGWLLSDGGPVKNKEDLVKLDELCTNFPVKWKHVAGHCGIHGNEEADKLARMAISK